MSDLLLEDADPRLTEEPVEEKKDENGAAAAAAGELLRAPTCGETPYQFAHGVSSSIESV